MGTVIYPFGILPVETVEVSTTANTYKPTVIQNCILYVKGSALAAASTIELTAHEELRAGSIVVVRWLSDGTARTVTIKPLVGANGQSFLGTASKATSVTLIYDGSVFIPLSHMNPVEVA